MDSIIQGQSQSALVQHLSEKEHHIKRFTHDIPDNSPVRSIQKVEVLPYVGRSDTQKEETYHFRIPRKGYLNRMWLKVRVASPTQEVLGLESMGRGIMRFGNFFEYASLFIAGKRIETLYPESVAYNAMTYKGVGGKNVIKGLCGLETSGLSVEPKFDFGRERQTNPSWETDSYGKDYLVPLDFSMFRFFKDSLDTNFLGSMEIEFKKREIVAIENPATYVKLICKYHNVLNNFRTNIRNANHSKDTTTKLITRTEQINETPQSLLFQDADSTPNRSYIYDS